MQITKEFHDVEKYDAYWSQAEMNDAMLNVARLKLEENDIRTPFVTLVSNDIVTRPLSEDEDPRMNDMHTCRATVRAPSRPTLLSAQPQLLKN